MIFALKRYMNDAIAVEKINNFVGFSQETMELFFNSPLVKLAILGFLK